MEGGREGYNDRKPQLHIDFTPHSLFAPKEDVSMGSVPVVAKPRVLVGSAMAKPLTLHECVQSGTCAVAASRHRTASCATGCTEGVAICLTNAPQAAQWLMQPRTYRLPRQLLLPRLLVASASCCLLFSLN